MASAAALEWAREQQYIERQFLDTETYKRFSRHNVWRWLLGVAGEWAVIGASFWACNQWRHWWVWVPAIFLIGTRQHALGIMAHEGVHFIVTRDLFWNDLLANGLAAYPLTYPVQGYRTNHLKHHRWLETQRDPERAALDLYPREWTYPMPRWRFYWLLLRDSLGLYGVQSAELVRYIWQVPGGAWPQVVLIGLYHGAVVAVAWATGYIWSYVLLWLVPLFTVAVMCFRLRTVAEHSAIGPPEARYTRTSVDTVASTRTTVGCPITSFLFAPHHMSYHVEHHLYPSVPVFRLKKLHRVLLGHPEFAAHARVTHGYGRLVDELTA